jgi:hypothetical protein
VQALHPDANHHERDKYGDEDHRQHPGWRQRADPVQIPEYSGLGPLNDGLAVNAGFASFAKMLSGLELKQHQRARCLLQLRSGQQSAFRLCSNLPIWPILHPGSAPQTYI